jgi:hypothetical protein
MFTRARATSVEPSGVPSKKNSDTGTIVAMSGKVARNDATSASAHTISHLEKFSARSCSRATCASLDSPYYKHFPNETESSPARPSRTSTTGVPCWLRPMIPARWRRRLCLEVAMISTRETNTHDVFSYKHTRGHNAETFIRTLAKSAQPRCQGLSTRGSVDDSVFILGAVSLEKFQKHDAFAVTVAIFTTPRNFQM